jgi:hypothetical protein
MVGLVITDDRAGDFTQVMVLDQWLEHHLG